MRMLCLVALLTASGCLKITRQQVVFEQEDAQDSTFVDTADTMSTDMVEDVHREVDMLDAGVETVEEVDATSDATSDADTDDSGDTETADAIDVSDAEDSNIADTAAELPLDTVEEADAGDVPDTSDADIEVSDAVIDASETDGTDVGPDVLPLCQTDSDCDDGDECTDDMCDPTLGCVNTAVETCFLPVSAGTYMYLDGNGQVLVQSVSAFEISATEVTVAEYQACVAAGWCSPPAVNPAEPEQCNGLDKPNHPVNCLTDAQASLYAGWQGMRLPTLHEWRFAARGGCALFGTPGCSAADDLASYPWGDDPPTCNLAIYKDGTGAGCGTQSTFPVGSRPFGASPYGMLDMAGNVAEIIDGGCEQPGDVMICGGGFASSVALLDIDGGCYCVSAFGSGYGNPNIGFRLIKE